MLSSDQRETLTEFILVQLPANPSIASIAIFVGDDVAADLPLLPTIRDISVWMIDQALRQQTPDILISLIRTVDNGQGELGSIISLADELTANAQLWLDWFSTNSRDVTTGGDPLHVEDGRPFIDRTAFRNFLPRPDSPEVAEAPACILVEGDIGSGKTYLYEYCKRLASHWQNFNVGCTTVGAGNVRYMTPEMASVDIARGFGTNLSRRPRVHEDPHRYARNLVTWITEFTPDRNVPSLAIFDGFDAAGVTEPMHTFIEELIRAVHTDEQARKRMRVLLLGYDASRLENQELEFSRCPLEFLDSTHIETWLERRFPDQPHYRYEDTAAIIEEQLPAGGEMRLHQLCNLVFVAMGEFREAQ